jgi:uncharacterized protein (DUF1499 family)
MIRFILIPFISFILASTVPSFAEKEPLSMKTMAVCPSRPNCVSSLAADQSHRIPPISFAGPVSAAQERLIGIIRHIPRSEIVKDAPGYLAVIFRSKVFGFVDEAEFAFDEKNGEINFYSGARTGYYDFGVNRSRLEKIRESFLEPKR